ncbi:DUF3152 domain-containing protein [Streptomyces thermolilacinus]|uniref:DUF3152 domain-containing protein n=1 Tax=Streptomyces thermolilacinus TaxID=285540 RepID=UPI00340CC6DC
MGKRGVPASRRRRGSRGARRKGSARRPPGRIVLGGAALGALALGGGAAVAHWTGGEPAAASRPAAAAPETPGTSARRSPQAPSPEASGKASPPLSPSPSASAEEEPDPPATVPHEGPGTFTTADASGAKVGTGTLRRYRVQVEDGIGLSAADAAREIEQILAHPRGWAAHGRGAFQLVSGNADFVIRIATPKTADKLCLAQGLNTRGEYNCETTEGVVVNLKRWLQGSPTFTGTPAEYRHLIINHEVGHEIGIRTHMTCPGPGKPAPVMMQQIKGLRGCVSNAWPYDEDGRYITGPIVP